MKRVNPQTNNAPPRTSFHWPRMDASAWLGRGYGFVDTMSIHFWWLLWYLNCSVCSLSSQKKKLPYLLAMVSKNYYVMLVRIPYIENLGMVCVCVWDHFGSQGLQTMKHFLSNNTEEIHSNGLTGLKPLVCSAFSWGGGHLQIHIAFDFAKDISILYLYISTYYII